MEQTENSRQETTIEESLKELDDIVEKLESREISLEESFTMYQKGMELLKQCSGKIDKVEKKMLKINEDGDLSEF
ncbi:exodeoxyribonuclease VII small subunit [Blautia sp. An46]|uniref:exodeoxyribonuclease VII small subunit n=1 Tax=Blautia sp. An46 TaxID=1965636 RepID=UPI000B37257F|nr:exodeoxyribonuclease VII small subunit [Blautia sp. An46]OUN95072.1 exodeoxyribonuclease VII small subunit [Blautia sp. An46]HJD36906.1 exodeoxyribonuclease VII small subunit [Candidatus Blautia ornithocaccae]